MAQGGFMQTVGIPSWVDLGAGNTPVAVSAGGFHTCAIVDNGSLYCWGSNANGRLGTGDPTTQSAYSPAWVDLGVGRTALAISAGGDHTCAILDDSSLTCFGSDYNGALGNGPGQGMIHRFLLVFSAVSWSDSTGSNSGSSAFDLTSSEGANLIIGEAMTLITLNYSYQIPQGYVTSGNNSTWYLQPTAGSQAYVLPCYQPNMVEMGDYYLAECEEDLSILDFNAGTRTTLVANAWPYTIRMIRDYCGLLKQTEQGTTC